MRDTRVTYRIACSSPAGELSRSSVITVVAAALHSVGIDEFYSNETTLRRYGKPDVPVIEVTVLCHHEDFPQSAVLHVAHLLAGAFRQPSCEWERTGSASGSEQSLKVPS
jgi:hypothetical protein